MEVDGSVALSCDDELGGSSERGYVDQVGCEVWVCNNTFQTGRRRRDAVKV